MIEEKTPEDNDIFKEFPKWWFIAGGGIHQAEKNQSIRALANLARNLPRIAWETAYNLAKEQERQAKEELQRKLDVAVKTLEFYADACNWDGDTFIPKDHVSLTGDPEVDCEIPSGKRAHEALEQIREGEK